MLEQLYSRVHSLNGSKINLGQRGCTKSWTTMRINRPRLYVH